MSGISTTAATPAGNCWRCGGQLYANLVHSCTTSSALPLPGRPDTTDPLDRMEHDGNRFFDLSWLGENGQSAGVLYETASDLAEHVLALVAVARAAREFPEPPEWKGANPGWSQEDVRVPAAALRSLHQELARLGVAAEEGDR